MTFHDCGKIPRTDLEGPGTLKDLRFVVDTYTLVLETLASLPNMIARKHTVSSLNRRLDIYQTDVLLSWTEYYGD